jgi:hypothetical protein
MKREIDITIQYDMDILEMLDHKKLSLEFEIKDKCKYLLDKFVRSGIDTFEEDLYFDLLIEQKLEKNKEYRRIVWEIKRAKRALGINDFPELKVDDAKRYPIEFLCDEYGIDINRNRGLCPFHKERTPSFTVNTSLNRYHCFGCGEHGDVIQFAMNKEGISFKEAVARLASK